MAGPPVGAARAHDEALRGVFAALEVGLDDSGVAVWVRALRAWHQAVSNDDYWAFALSIEARGAFEPAALLSELDAVRADAVRLAAEALVVGGRDALARNDRSVVHRILVALEELADTGSWAATAQEDIAAPAVERFRALCCAVREELGSKMVREQDAAERNKSACDAALKRFRAEIEPALAGAAQILPPGHETAQRSRQEAAVCLKAIAIDYTWADDFITSEGLHEEALKLARDEVGAIRIEHGLAQVRDAARKQRLFGALKPISSAPPLRTINGFGFMLYGNSDYDPETQSYATTYYFVALFIPVFPLGRYRVVNAGGNQYRFLGKLPLRKADRWHLGLAAVAVAALILSGSISSSRKSARQSQLSSLKARIDSDSLRVSSIESQLQPVFDEIITSEARMDSLASELKSLHQRHDAGVQIDIDAYNADVDTYNDLLSRHRALLAANSSDLQLYNELAQEDSALVAQYNALLEVAGP